MNISPTSRAQPRDCPHSILPDTSINLQRIRTFEIAQHAATRAGEELLSIQSSRPTTAQKNDGSWVSSADFFSEKLLADFIRSHTTTNEPILSEESPDKFNFREGWKVDAQGIRRFTGWIIDPLDGTGNYLLGSENWGVIVAYVENDIPTVGAISLPALHVQLGAWLDDQHRAVVCNDPQPPAADAGTRVIEIDYASLPIMEAQQIELKVSELKKSCDNPDLPIEIREFKRGGCSAHALYRLWRGDTGAFIHLRSTPWDHAAGALIIEQSGGIVQDLSSLRWSPRMIPAHQGSPCIIQNGMDLSMKHKTMLACTNFQLLPVIHQYFS